MTYTYRHLSTADVPILQSLLRVFGDAFNDMDAYQGAVPGDRYLLQLLAKPHFIVVVAMNEDEVIGGLAAYNWRSSSRTDARSTSMTSQSPRLTAGAGWRRG